MRTQEWVFKGAGLAILVVAGAGAGMALHGVTNAPPLAGQQPGDAAINGAPPPGVWGRSAPSGDAMGGSAASPGATDGPLTPSPGATDGPLTPLPGVTASPVTPAPRTTGDADARPPWVPVPRPAPAPGFRAPIYYQPFGGDVNEVAAAMAASGARDFILAFVLDSGGCRPAWQGETARPVGGDSAAASAVATIRRGGGDVSVSFGGAVGAELGDGCGSARKLADAYQRVVDAYQLTRIDLDYEGNDLTSGIDVRMAAVRLLLDRARADHRTLKVSLTLPVGLSGLPAPAVGGVRAALRAGVRPEVVNLMAFDFGAATTAAQIRGAVDAAHRQVRGLFGGSDAAAYGRLGLQVMNGHTDVRGEQFLPGDVRALVEYARTRQLGWVSFWSLNRDRSCASTGTAWAVSSCSGVAQRPYEYASIVAGYQG